VLAGHVSAHTHKLCQEGGNPLRPGWWRPMRVDDAVTNAVLGLLVYKVRACGIQTPPDSVPC
jgi:hypothetical protein